MSNEEESNKDNSNRNRNESLENSESPNDKKQKKVSFNQTTTEKDTKQLIDKSKDILVDNFVILTKIGNGAFGQIFLSYDMRGNSEVAVKKEIKKNQKTAQVKIESRIYQELLTIPQGSDLSGVSIISQDTIQGVPKFYGVGECIEFYYMILEFLGPNLIELLKYCDNKKFSVITVSLLALQMLNRIENLHKHNYIHRDIKPENFLIGTGKNSNIVYLIDFGLSKRYKNPKTHQHIHYKEGRPLIGTARYVSINCHLGIEQSRRDDLESIGYVLVFFLKGVLPWQGLKDVKNKYKKIMEKKLQIPTEILCFGLPEEITVYLNYCKSLKFEDRPHYDYVRGLFLRLLSNSANTYGITRDNLRFDWCYEDKKTLMQIFQMKKNDSSMESDFNANRKNHLGDDNRLSLINEEEKKENNESLIQTNKNQNIENSGDLSEGKNSSESGDGSESSSQNTVKFEFNGVVQSKEIEQEAKVDFNGILHDMVNPETIDKYIDEIILSGRDPNEVYNDDDGDGKNISINNTLTFKKNSKSNDNNKNEDDDDKLDKIEQEKEKKIGEQSKALIEKLKNLTLEPQPTVNKGGDDEEEIKNDKDDDKKKKNLRSPMKHLSDHGIKKNVDLILQKEQYIKISRKPVTQFYQILGNLGQGSYGKVKKVLHKQLNEYRAMKIVNKKLASSSNEIEILRKISHPNIVNIFEIFEDKKKYYIMSEFCDGGELFSAIAEKGFFTELEANKLIKQILQTVNYLHSNNIVHRDLKPENIMLMANGKDLKVIDFGTAVELPKKKKLTKFIGTAYYIAPEVIQQNYDEKCDIWSCGIILYILLCGYPPFNGPSNNDIYSAIQHSKLLFKKENWQDVSKEAISLIKKMLDKNPKKRPSAEDCLNNPWFNIMSFNRQASFKINKLEILERMAQFVQQNKFKQAVLQFISTQFNLKKEEESLKHVFKAFDKDGKGVISRKDFMEQIEKLYGNVISEEITNQFFSTLDLDNSGAISYNEFLTSVIDSHKILTEDRLRKAFDMFDKDGSGTLDLGEIKQYFGGNDKTWKRVLKDIDENGDGCVDFQEFKKMMIGFDPDQIVSDKTVGKDEDDKQLFN